METAYLIVKIGRGGGYSYKGGGDGEIGIFISILTNIINKRTPPPLHDI